MVSIGHVQEVMERLLDTIASSLATMIAEADQATENKTALLNLATKSRDILEPQLEAIRSKLKAAKIDYVLPALTCPSQPSCWTLFLYVLVSSILYVHTYMWWIVYGSKGTWGGNRRKSPEIGASTFTSLSRFSDV